METRFDEPMKLHFAVEVNSDVERDEVSQVLRDNKEIKHFNFTGRSQSLVIESVLPVSELLSILERSGKRVLFKDIESKALSMIGQDYASGVSIIKDKHKVFGVCRFFQPSDDNILADCVLDGLEKFKTLRLAFHQYGDISEWTDSCGDELRTKSLESATVGETDVDESGQWKGIFKKSGINLWEIIGRSVVLHDPSQQLRIACGIIARSAGLFMNKKDVCACDGTTQWEFLNLSEPKQ